MIIIKLTGWSNGFNKIQFNHFLQDKFGMGLAEAKNNIDKILSNECIELKIQNFSNEDKKNMSDLKVEFEIKYDEK